jgi:hypothetical protein
MVIKKQMILNAVILHSKATPKATNIYFCNMKFTRYYSRLIKAQGVPHLNTDQHCRLMNIIALEGRLTVLESLKKDLNNTTDHHKFDMKIHQVNLQIKLLTEDQFPKDVLQNMVFRSKVH